LEYQFLRCKSRVIIIVCQIGFDISSSVARINRVDRFGEKLHALRTQRGMTVRELAAALEVKSHSHVVQIESGKRKPSVDLLIKIINLFDVSCDQLLNDDLELT
jgi:DNA-binding XRE family transcriptional regulator